MNEITRMAGSGDAGGTALFERRLQQNDKELIGQLNRGYVCPADAGPAWRAAHAAGIDMALVEDALRLTPGERLRAHQRALNLVLALARVRPSHDSGSRSSA